MKITAVASVAVIALLLAGVAAIAFAHGSEGNSSTSVSTNSHNQGNQGDEDNHGKSLSCKGLTVGESISITGLKGHYQDAANRGTVGVATGNVNLQVSNTYFDGCSLSITGGTINLGYSAYGLTGGTIVLNRGGHSGDGWGSASTGSFLIQVEGLRGTSTSAALGAVSIDLKSSTSEFLVFLHSG
jgi:hypothetical protein